MNYGDPRLRTLLAGEYVLGTLPARARRRFKRVLAEDAGLRAEVAAWHRRLDGLASGVQPVAPPPEIWQAIERRLVRLAARPDASRAPVGTRAGPRAFAERLWQSLAIWRGAALAAGALAAALLVYVATIRPPPPPAPTQVAVVSNTEPAWLIEANAEGRRLVAQTLRPQPLQAGRAFELWSVPAEGAPRSLGLLPAAGRAIFSLDDAQAAALRQAAAFAVSLEPEGGSPTGSPTGPVLYQGPTIRPE